MLKGIILIVLAAAFWGLGGVAGQYLFQYHQVDAVWLVMVRQIVAGLLFLLYTAVIIRQNIFTILLIKRDGKESSISVTPVLFLRRHFRSAARLLLHHFSMQCSNSHRAAIQCPCVGDDLYELQAPLLA